MVTKSRNGSSRRRQRYYVVRDVEDPSTEDWKSCLFPSQQISIPLMERMIRTILDEENVSTSVKTFSQVCSMGIDEDIRSVLIPVLCTKEKVWILVRVEIHEDANPIITVHNTVKGHRLSRRRLRSRIYLEMRNMLERTDSTCHIRDSTWNWKNLPLARGLESNYFLLMSIQRRENASDDMLHFSRYETWRLRQYLTNEDQCRHTWIYASKKRRWFRIKMENHMNTRRLSIYEERTCLVRRCDVKYAT